MYVLWIALVSSENEIKLGCKNGLQEPSRQTFRLLFYTSRFLPSRPSSISNGLL